VLKALLDQQDLKVLKEQLEHKELLGHKELQDL
jgi:hypothetical protein